MACEVLESALVCMSQQVCTTYRDIWASVYYLICSCTFRSTRSKCMRRSCRMIDHTIVDCMVISDSRCVLTYHCKAYYAKRCADLSCTTKRLKEKKRMFLYVLCLQLPIGSFPFAVRFASCCTTLVLSTRDVCSACCIV